jgi:hypothetical protein
MSPVLGTYSAYRMEIAMFCYPEDGGIMFIRDIGTPPTRLHGFVPENFSVYIISATDVWRLFDVYQVQNYV